MTIAIVAIGLLLTILGIGQLYRKMSELEDRIDKLELENINVDE